ncbi:multicopper oxidase family protein [Micromonospora citrea]|uniref:multicopper oxidase family protein n=1 Tax=Micromonospora citrea TaxID=47855 RepID=UPI003C686A26
MTKTNLTAVATAFVLATAVPVWAAGNASTTTPVTGDTSHGAATSVQPSGSGAHHEHADPKAMDAAMAKRDKSFPAKTAGQGAPDLEPTVTADGTKEFALTAKIAKWELEPGKVVDAWTFNGTVPGPTLKVAVGDKVRVVVKNELPESTSVHWHGILLPNEVDGVANLTQDPIKPSETFTYEFTAERPSVGWFHSHHDGTKQVANGLWGTILMGEMPRPEGVTVAQSRTMHLQDGGVIGLSLNGKSFPATEPVHAKLNEWVEIHYVNAGGQAHPMHLHGLDQLVIAKDGYPVATPYKADTVLVAPGERYTVLIKADRTGDWLWHCHIFSHAEGSQGMFGMVTALTVS